MFKRNYVLPSILFSISTFSFGAGGVIQQNSTDINANTSGINTNTSDINDNSDKLNQYLKNLGQYFGYDITEYCTTGGSCSSQTTPSYSNQLFNMNDTYLAQLNLYNSYLGALLGSPSAESSTPSLVVPTNTKGYSILNSLVGQTYISPAYSTSSSTAISVSPLIDQPSGNGGSYQPDPVSQAVLNIISTPTYSFCFESNSTKPIPNCRLLYREKIMANVLGVVPGTQLAFTPGFNQSIVTQLNSNTLLTPLLYSSTGNNNSSSTPSSAPEGLPSETQAQQAENYIRYATGATNPLELANRNAYDQLVITARNIGKDPSITPQEQLQAQQTLTTYILGVRTYTAQISVGISNLYYILSRRMPQKIAGTEGNGSGGNATSEALNEFTMATWRLYNPNAPADSASAQWLNKINTGSSATVQKEMAVLLSEINYQMYLNRQQQERLLLTESMLLLATVQVYKPSPGDVNNPSSSSTSQ